MVGFVQTAERDRHEAEAAAEECPKPQEGPLRPPYPEGAAAAVKSLSPSRRRLLELLQRQLLLQLAANRRGGDIDPRRRPPHAATPHGILARWLAADPRRLRGSCLLHGLSSRKAFTRQSEAPKPSSSISSSQRPLAKSGEDSRVQAAPSAGTGTAETQHATAEAAAAASFLEQQRPAGAAAVPGSCPLRESQQQEEAASAAAVGGAAREGEPQREQLARKAAAAAAGAPDAGLTNCVVCLSPYKPVCGGFLCTPCLLRLGSAPASVQPQASVASRDAVAKAQRPQAEQRMEASCSRQLDGSLCPAESGDLPLADSRMPRRRRFKRSASPAAKAEAQHHHHHQQQEAAEPAGGSSRRDEEAAGWRARATAAAAATESSSSWWGPSEATGDAPVVPPLLLPLLPSIFSLHARPWPPPPAKRRRLTSRRRRGLGCLSLPRTEKQHSWGSLHQLASPANTQHEQLPPPHAPPTQRAAQAGAAAADSDAAAAAAGENCPPNVLGGEGSSALGETVAARQGAASHEACVAPPAAGGARTPGSSTSCLGALCPPPASKAEKATPSQGSVCCCCAAAPTEGSGSSCLCSCSDVSPPGFASAAAPARRRGRLSAPAACGGADAAGVSALEAAAREIAAAAAVVATLKTEAQQREQQTPPPRTRRRSCCPDTGLPPENAATAAAAEGAAPPVCVSTGCSASLAGTVCSAVAASSVAGGCVSAAAFPSKAPNAAAAAVPAGCSGSLNAEGKGPRCAREAAAGASSGRQGGLARISQGLIVGPSSLGRGSGLGVYSCRDFSRRSLVCEYSGVLIDRSTALLLRRMRCSSHVINVQMQHSYLLGFHTPCPLLGGGAFVNDGRWRTGGGEGPGVSVRFRVLFDRHRAAQRVLIVATKDIKKGQELLTSYDNDYWRLIAQNAQQKKR